MRLLKSTIFLLLTTTLVISYARAQDEVIALAYRTVNVRNGPGTQYDIIGQLTSGNEMLVTGRSDEESNWLRIGFEGREGWVAFFTVTVLDDTTDLPIVAPRNSPLATATREPVTPTSLRAVTDTFITTYRTVNVRSGPGTDYVRIGNLAAGSTADVTGRSADDEWLRINFGGRLGWVAFFVVSLTGSLDDITVVEAAAGAETEEAPDTVGIVTRYNVNLHEQPALDSPIVGIVPFDTPLQAEARSEGESWLQVTYNGRVGWLMRALVYASADLDRLPVE